MDLTGKATPLSIGALSLKRRKRSQILTQTVISIISRHFLQVRVIYRILFAPFPVRQQELPASAVILHTAGGGSDTVTPESGSPTERRKKISRSTRIVTGTDDMIRRGASHRSRENESAQLPGEDAMHE